MELGREAHHPVLGDHLVVRVEVRKGDAGVRVVERQFGLRMVLPAAGAFVVRLGAEPQPGLPEQLSPGEAEVGEAADPDEVLDRGAFE